MKTPKNADEKVADEPKPGAAPGLSAEDADLYRSDAGAGLENVTSGDLQIPFLRILQTGSPEVNRRAPADYVEGAEAGMIYNTATGALYESLTVVPAYYHKRFTEWWPRDSDAGQGLVKDHGTDSTLFDATERDDKGRRVTADGTEISDSGTWYLTVVPTGETVVLPFGSTQLKKSRQWLTKASSMSVEVEPGKRVTPPLFYYAWTLTAVPESNGKGDWFGWKIEPVMPTVQLDGGRDLYLKGRDLRKKVADGTLSLAPQAMAKALSDQRGGAEGEGENLPF